MADTFCWDTRPLYVYAQTPKDKYDIIEARYNVFLEKANDAQTEPVGVFSARNELQLKELALIREVSEVLQAKKDEDIRKSKAAAEDAENEEQDKKEEKVEEEEKKEEAPVETEA